MSVAYTSLRLTAIVFPELSFFFPYQTCQTANCYIYYNNDQSITMFLSISLYKIWSFSLADSDFMNKDSVERSIEQNCLFCY